MGKDQMSISVLLGQILVIFLEIGAGYAAGKAKILTAKSGKTISSIVMSVTLPASMLAAADLDEPGAVNLLLPTFGLLLALYLITTVLTTLLARGQRLGMGKKAVLITLGVLPNSTFMGIPLAAALLGNGPGMVFGAAGVIAYNLLFFTYMTKLFDPATSFTPKSLATPANLCTLAMVVMLLLGVHFSGPPQQFLSAVGNCTTPLALMLVGLMLAQTELRSLFTVPFLYLITLLRCFVFPLVFMLVLHFAHCPPLLAMGAIILAACPCGSLGAVMAEQCGVEPKLASQAVAQSTLFSALSMPVVILLAQQFFVL